MSIREHTASASATVREPVKVCVPLHTLQAYVSMRQHTCSSGSTSAYVSIRRWNSKTLQQLGYAAARLPLHTLQHCNTMQQLGYAATRLPLHTLQQ